MINKVNRAKFIIILLSSLLSLTIKTAQEFQESELIDAVCKGDIKKFLEINKGNIDAQLAMEPLDDIFSSQDLEQTKLFRNREDNNGATLLTKAIKDKNIELVEKLMSIPDLDSVNHCFDQFILTYQGIAPLIEAIKTDQPEVVALLICKMGFFAENILQHKDEKGKIPMQYAAKQGSQTVIDLLFKGPSLAQFYRCHRDNEGQSIFDAAKDEKTRHLLQEKINNTE